MGRAVETRGCGGRLGEIVAAQRLPGPSTSLGGGADVLLDRPQQEDEQRLREIARDQRSVHLRSDEPSDGEAFGSLMRLFGRSLHALGSIELLNKRQGPRTKRVRQHKVRHGTEFPADSEYR